MPIHYIIKSIIPIKNDRIIYITSKDHGCAVVLEYRKIFKFDIIVIFKVGQSMLITSHTWSWMISLHVVNKFVKVEKVELYVYVVCFKYLNSVSPHFSCQFSSYKTKCLNNVKIDHVFENCIWQFLNDYLHYLILLFYYNIVDKFFSHASKQRYLKNLRYLIKNYI